MLEINEDSIRGKIGPAEVLIPKSKMDLNCTYQRDENHFLVKVGESSVKIDKGTKVRCKCFEIKNEMSTPSFIQISR